MSATRSTKQLRKRIKDTLRTRHVDLIKTLELNKETFSGKMYALGLIGDDAHESRDCRTILKEFEVGLNFVSNDPKILRTKYLKFIEVLQELGGAAEAIATELLADINWTPPETSSLLEHWDHREGLNYLSERILHDSNLSLVAKRLEKRFISLVIHIRRSLIDHRIDLQEVKIILCLALGNGAPSYIQENVRNAEDIDKLIDILIFNQLIGYLNYGLLKKIYEELVDDLHDLARNKLDEYEKEYVKLIKRASFRWIINAFRKNSQFSKTALVGLPHVVFHLEKSWLEETFYNWTECLSVFSWSESVLLKEVKESSVLVIYTILPSALSDVIKDLTNPEILQNLQKRNVTVYELPIEGEDLKVSEVSGNVAAASTTDETHSFLDGPLISAVKSLNLSEVIRLLKEGANPNCVPSKVLLSTPAGNMALPQWSDPIVTHRGETTQLHRACRMFHGGDIRYIEHFLHVYSSDINARDEEGNTPLHILMKSPFGFDDDDELIRLLKEFFDKGADPNIQNEEGNAPLHLLMGHGFGGSYGENKLITLSKEFFSKGADPNIQNKDGDTPLHIQMARRDILDLQQRDFIIKVFKGLSGVDLSIKNNEGKSVNDLMDDEMKRKFKT